MIRKLSMTNMYSRILTWAAGTRAPGTPGWKLSFVVKDISKTEIWLRLVGVPQFTEVLCGSMFYAYTYVCISIYIYILRLHFPITLLAAVGIHPVYLYVWV